MGQYVDEFRGTDMLVYAEVLTDNNEVGEGYTTGTVKILAPVAEISKTVETASDTKYYDNKPALVINGEGADTITLTVPALDLKTLADITGKKYDLVTGAFMDGERKPKNFALGYRLKLTDGTYRYVWRYKGTFAIPDETSQTENAGTDSNNQQLTYTGIETMHTFTKPNASQKALVLDERDGKAYLDNFFDTVTTCDTVTPLIPVSASVANAAGVTMTILRNGKPFKEYDGSRADEDDFTVYVGDALKVTFTGGTLKINNTSTSTNTTYNVTSADVTDGIDYVTTASA